jgi:hypothetical protein
MEGISALQRDSEKPFTRQADRSGREDAARAAPSALHIACVDFLHTSDAHT